MIECVDTGLVYRNPKPYLRSIHAWHPTLVRLEGELLASFDVAQASESLDYHTVLSRSSDDGKTWSDPKRIFEDPVQPTSHSVRISAISDGTLVAFGVRCDRSRAEEGLNNRANMGLVPAQLIMLRSPDGGQTWEGPMVVEPPLVGPAFEICHSILELRDGRWLWPTQTWRGWEGDAPNGMKAIALVSRDRGKTWPDYIDVMDDYRNGVIHWEQSLCQMPDDSLLAVAWAFHEPSGTTRPTPFAVAKDAAHFSRPNPAGIHGQTAKVLSLDRRNILCVYRRDDQPGLWGTVAEVHDERWNILAEKALWVGATSGMAGRLSNSDELTTLKFGYPSLLRCPDHEVLCAFWCYEEEVYNIRWIRLRVNG